MTAKVRVADRTKLIKLPTREELAALALDVYKLALDHKREFMDRNGNQKGYSQPEFNAAVNALRLAADISGFGHKGKDPKELSEAEAIDAEEALERMRSKLAKEVSEPAPKVMRAEKV